MSFDVKLTRKNWHPRHQHPYERFATMRSDISIKLRAPLQLMNIWRLSLVGRCHAVDVVSVLVCESMSNREGFGDVRWWDSHVWGFCLGSLLLNFAMGNLKRCTLKSREINFRSVFLSEARIETSEAGHVLVTSCDLHSPKLTAVTAGISRFSAWSCCRCAARGAVQRNLRISWNRKSRRSPRVHSAPWDF